MVAGGPTSVNTCPHLHMENEHPAPPSHRREATATASGIFWPRS